MAAIKTHASCLVCAVAASCQPLASGGQAKKETASARPFIDLTKLRTVTFQASIWRMDARPGSRRVTKLRDVRVMAAPPGSIRVEVIAPPKPDVGPVKNGQFSFTFHGPLSDTFVADGKRQCESNLSLRAFGAGEAAVTTARLFNAGKAAATIARVRGELPDLLHLDILFDRDLSDFKRIRTQVLDGRNVIVYASVGVQHPVRARYVLYVDRETRMPCRFAEEYLVKGRFVPDGDRVDYTAWHTNVDLPASIFDPTPPPDAKPLK